MIMPLSLALFGGIYPTTSLRAKLTDIASRGDDLRGCLGDLGGFGPHPERTHVAELMRESGGHSCAAITITRSGHRLPECGLRLQRPA